jgi:hypothetical protein
MSQGIATVLILLSPLAPVFYAFIPRITPVDASFAAFAAFYLYLCSFWFILVTVYFLT